jgi:hypothetical protein
MSRPVCVRGCGRRLWACLLLTRIHFFALRTNKLSVSSRKSLVRYMSPSTLCASRGIMHVCVCVCVCLCACARACVSTFVRLYLYFLKTCGNKLCIYCLFVNSCENILCMFVCESIRQRMRAYPKRIRIRPGKRNGRGGLLCLHGCCIFS